MVAPEESRWERGGRRAREYWRDAVWPALKFCLILTVIVTVVGFVVIDIMNW